MIANHINCETTGKILGYRDLVKMDTPVWEKKQCAMNLAAYPRGEKKHAGTEKIEFIFHKVKAEGQKGNLRESSM